MTITPAIVNSFKLELLQELVNDTFKMALYSSLATLDADTAVYSATNEITGTGYTAGGKIMTISSGYPQLDSGTGQAWMRFDDVTWTSATLTARGALVYNASRSNKAVAVLSFGTDATASGGSFTVTMPLASPPLIVIT